VRCSLTGSSALVEQTGRVETSPFSLVTSRVLTAPLSALQRLSNTAPTTSVCLMPFASGNRMITSRELPKFCTCTSPKLSFATVSRIFSTSAVCA
jgi:hypothetical protein